ncbi:hypothetical protein [Nonomuraea guangzhouensis]|uniref:DUF4245 domain-containing protein n=1 Tax=Nonomuraea guangzhouensis TaxID=1291555 RepID=A0ABW4G4M0_9ACTN|nr:hypothetical protein [Nonomuraea guangzhouensis]
MMPEGGTSGQALRAMLAFLALGVTASIIYGLFSSGFGRVHPVPVGAPSLVRTGGPAPVAGGATAPAPAPAPVRGASVTASTRIAVVSNDFWLTYLPAGLDRADGGAIEPDQGAWARFAPKTKSGGYVEVRVEHGPVAADWLTYQRRISLRTPRDTTVRGRPALVGRYPGGGLMIVWLERAGTGASVRVSESLGEELLRVAASVKAPVGD